jgi:hypothetical protein
MERCDGIALCIMRVKRRNDALLRLYVYSG